MTSKFRNILAIAFSAFAISISAQTDTEWALPRISVANVREAPAHSAELGSQALMGMPVKITGKDGQWYKVETPEGYNGWIVDNSLAIKTPEQMNQWRSASRLVVTAPYQTRAYTSPSAAGLRDVVTDLVLGDIVEGSLNALVNGRVEITLPDGRRGWAPADALATVEDWAAQSFDSQKILDIAYSMEGTPYLWGGTSIKSLDCSGLSKISYLSNGIILKRNASQQARTGGRIEAADWRDCMPGDLLFFGNPDTGKVTHVAIYDHDGWYVHSSGRVKRNSLDPDSPGYLDTPFLHAVRIHGYENTDGITPVAAHPWYFNN